jgi:FAD/FMN-containing dehydrogenase
MTFVSSWGRLSAYPHHVIPCIDALNIKSAFSEGVLPGIAYGMGRSYGDVCLNPEGTLWEMRSLDHFLRFDNTTGRLVCEAGVLLQDIQRLMVPRGWILPVTPGTQMITVGGAIANDIHGKNHHVFGAFGDHIHSLTIIRTNGETIQCGPTQNTQWFSATVGGLGLTGIIIHAELQLRPISSPWLETETIPFENLDDFFHLADSSENQWEHTVSWIDCLSGKRGRGIFLRANFSEMHGTKALPHKKSLAMPFTPPVSLVNRFTLKPFNQIYYALQKRKAGRGLSHYESFFYPLDNLFDWNRIYGPRGFFQYQSVIPRKLGLEGTRTMLDSISRSGEGSFLAVLKTFGNREAQGMLSFPQPGVTLALDFPNRGERTLKLFESLDAIVRETKGRIYAAKDARMPRDLFELGYPKLAEFLHYRDPGISSSLSRRLMGN